MYPHDNIFNIYYNIGKRTPFLVKRCELGLARSSSEERRIDPNRDRTFLVETVKPRGKYGKAYGKCFMNGKPDDTYRKECYPNIKDEEIPCAGCGEWVLIDVPGVSLDEIFPIHKADEILMFGKYKGKSLGDIYKMDYQYLYWLETTDRLFKIDFKELKRLYPNVEKTLDISISERIIDFGKYKGQKFGDIKDDISYLEWLVSIGKISIEDFNLLTTYNQLNMISMKKILITLTVLFAVIDIMAQEHLSFKGIPIEGSMTEFCQKLKSKGFTSIGRENNITLFSGDFTGRQATVGVTATDDGKNVFAVVVLFDPSGEWNTLVNTYDYYKDLYTRKYGKPTISKENNPAHLDSNTALMAEVHQGTVVYGSAWEVTGGDIQLSIEKSSGVYEGMVMIRYRDSQNIEAKIQNDLDDI